LFVSCLVSN